MKNELKSRVMTRIYVEYVKNAMFARVEYLLGGAALLAFFASVSVQNVLINMPKDDAVNMLNFLFIALRNTEWLVQAALAAIAVWLGFIGYRIFARIELRATTLFRGFGFPKLIRY